MKRRKIMNKPQILNGVKFKKEKINVYKLHSVLDCQRMLDDDFVQQIYDNWIDGYYNNPIVNFINGQYRLIGGQHTVSAFIKRLNDGLEDNATIECKVSNNLTESQEKAMFRYDEECGRSQNYKNKLQAYWGYTSEIETDFDSRKLFDVNNILNKYGYTIKCNKNQNITVDCTETLLNMTLEDLDECFSFLKEIFPYDKNAVKANFIKAVDLFLKLFSFDIDIEKFRNVSKATKTRKLLSADLIMETSKSYKQYEKKLVKQIAYSLSIEYIKRVRGSRLPLYKFDM